MGFRYRCQQCHNYQLCQTCFWRGHASGPHSNQHQMKEHSSWVRRRGLARSSRAVGPPQGSRGKSVAVAEPHWFCTSNVVKLLMVVIAFSTQGSLSCSRLLMCGWFPSSHLFFYSPLF